ncbi:hypothetical protein MMC30_002031 [Trapelia coarctata]|nr:hypothetical protein [Trapelia coarctata]
MDRKPQLLQTFGPEIECFWEYTRDHAVELEDFAKDDETMRAHLFNGTYIRHDLTDRLDHEGIPVQTEDENFDIRLGYQQWTIIGEELWHPDPLPEGSVRINIEVVGRILNYDQSGFGEVRRVLRVMGEYTNPPFTVNSATGLHVHVGSNQPYTLSWLKGFTQLVTAFEHEIETLHPDHRAYTLDGDVNEFCKPPSQSPELLPQEGPVVGIAVLEGCPNIKTLQAIFCGDSIYSRYAAYNIVNIGDKDPINPKETIEFRQHQGTLDAEEILHWVTFVGALVRYAYYTDHEELLTFCMRHLRDWRNGGQYTVFDLMEIIGVSFLIPFYTPKADLGRPRQPLENMSEDTSGQNRPDTQFMYDLLKDTAVEGDATVGKVV